MSVVSTTWYVRYLTFISKRGSNMPTYSLSYYIRIFFPSKVQNQSGTSNMSKIPAAHGYFPWFVFSVQSSCCTWILSITRVLCAQFCCHQRYLFPAEFWCDANVGSLCSTLFRQRHLLASLKTYIFIISYVHVNIKFSINDGQIYGAELKSRTNTQLDKPRFAAVHSIVSYSGTISNCQQTSLQGALWLSRTPTTKVSVTEDSTQVTKTH